MSRNQRIGLLAAAAAIAVVAIVVAVASGGSDNNDQATETTQTTGQGQSQTGSEQPTETAPTEPAVHRIQIRDGKVVGGTAAIKVTKGDDVTIVVSANAPDDVHLHGYDIEKPVEPGKPATFRFTADIEGIFEIESHKAEDEGRDPLLGKLTVEPG